MLGPARVQGGLTQGWEGSGQEWGGVPFRVGTRCRWGWRALWEERAGKLCGSASSTSFLPAALIFDGSTNPAHPKHIGSIDPNCSVSEVVKGRRPPLCLTEEPL